MGLPLAVRFAGRGASVIACDINESLVKAINEGECPIDEPGLAEPLAKAVKDGRLRAVTDALDAATQSDVIVVIVPALLTSEKRADLSKLEAVARTIAPRIKHGSMICFETTVPVGTTRDVLAPCLEAGGLKAGEDFDVVFSPERVKSRTVLESLSKNPKIVGGITPEAAARAEKFYARHLGAPVINLGTLEASELAKLAGMLYRDVNIALSNELSRYAEAAGVDLGPVLEAANTDGESALLSPGIGVGGHCTPVYPYFLTADARDRSSALTLAERARVLNDDQSVHAVSRLEREWGPAWGKRALILGLGFRPEVKEHAYSTAFLLQSELKRVGAKVRLHDPLYRPEELEGHGFTPGDPDGDPAPEILILCTAHPLYSKLDFPQLRRRGLRAVIDGRNLWAPEVIRREGIAYFGMGRPSAKKAVEAPK